MMLWSASHFIFQVYVIGEEGILEELELAGFTGIGGPVRHSDLIYKLWTFTVWLNFHFWAPKFLIFVFIHVVNLLLQCHLKLLLHINSNYSQIPFFSAFLSPGSSTWSDNGFLSLMVLKMLIRQVISSYLNYCRC